MPWVAAMRAGDLASVALEVCPTLRDTVVHSSLQTALQAAKTESAQSGATAVLCGSLYLVGNFLGAQSVVAGAEDRHGLQTAETSNLE
jgi:folylpolyglutamate synthase/dihydropteroate synthase|eukprot:SAG25_NODE_30_length_20554_cov_36.028694_12_plen_88_part_00